MILKNKTAILLESLAFGVSVFLLVSCSTSKNLNRDFLYFQSGFDSVAVPLKEKVIQPDDLLSIRVSSATLNQEQAAVFNLPNSHALNSPSENATGSGYLVSMNGYIELPIIGTVKAAGLTKSQLQEILTERLMPYVKSPAVAISFLQFKVNVLGEVKSPGTHNFTTDRVTIMDAIGAANDLTDHGKRKNVMVIREENGVRKYFNVDLTNGELFKSPAYQLQPNDIVYVSADNNKLRSLNVNPDTQRRTGFVFSLVSIATTIATLIVTLLK